MSDSLHRLIVLSGPSCAGKSPLKKAIQRQYPKLLEGAHIPVLYNSRAPRPDEEDGKDYHFRPRKHLEELRSRDGFLVLAARDDLQAIDLEELSRLLASGDVFYEGNVHIALRLMAEQRLPAHSTLDAFMSVGPGTHARWRRAPRKTQSSERAAHSVEKASGRRRSATASD